MTRGRVIAKVPEADQKVLRCQRIIIQGQVLAGLIWFPNGIAHVPVYLERYWIHSTSCSRSPGCRTYALPDVGRGHHDSHDKGKARSGKTGHASSALEIGSEFFDPVGGCASFLFVHQA